ncbi:hypothetical protein M3Y94_00714400 [Aphelenchoides besseyi]|nr:hypothetical protein M3Y94_00714400 [Aphelenchoides besseyi]KAI6231741.1 hypothetical protein M3Y95_00413700 [Aphelenchoides besseyi]
MTERQRALLELRNKNNLNQIVSATQNARASAGAQKTKVRLSRGELPEAVRLERRRRERLRYHERKNDLNMKKRPARGDMTVEERELHRQRDRLRYQRAKSKESAATSTADPIEQPSWKDVGMSELLNQLKTETDDFEQQSSYLVGPKEILEDNLLSIDYPCCSTTSDLHSSCTCLYLSDLSLQFRSNSEAQDLKLKTIRKTALCFAILRQPLSTKTALRLCSAICAAQPGNEPVVWFGHCRNVTADLPEDSDAAVCAEDVDASIRRFLFRCSVLRQQAQESGLEAVNANPVFENPKHQTMWKHSFELQRAQIFYDAAVFIDSPFVFIGDNSAQNIHDSFSTEETRHLITHLSFAHPNVALIRMQRVVFASTVQIIAIAFDDLIAQVSQTEEDQQPSIEDAQLLLNSLVDLCTENASRNARVFCLPPPFNESHGSNRNKRLVQTYDQASFTNLFVARLELMKPVANFTS